MARVNYSNNNSELNLILSGGIIKFMRWKMRLSRRDLLITGTDIGATILGISFISGSRYISGLESKAGKEATVKAERKAIVFEKLVDKVTQYAGINSTQIIQELQPEFIFRAWWRWRAGSPPERYQALANKIAEIKQISDATICGAIHTIALWRREWDDYTFEWIYYPKTWEMALDPQKWGLPMLKEKYQYVHVRTGAFWSGSYDQYEPQTVPCYAPDLSNPDYQDLLYHIGLRQIESGCDAIWIDAWHWTVDDMAQLANDATHPAVEDLVAGFNTICDMFRQHNVPVGSWYSRVPFKQKLDFVTIWAATPQEILNFNISEDRIEQEIQNIKDRVGNVPIYAFIDWGGWNPPMYAFSQQLSPQKQKEFLEYMTSFYSNYPEITLAYPVHGGTMSSITQPANILSYGRFDIYDSNAPEFNIYPTIKSLITGL